MIKLYSYWRSSAAYRIRIALNLKGLEYEIVPVNMVKDGGEQHSEQYKSLNPQGLVPTLIDDTVTLTQSMAILEYLEDKYPNPALLPDALTKRAFARQIAQTIACDIHPLDNLRVLKYLSGTLKVNDEEKNIWYHHWIIKGFDALEAWLRSGTGPYCLGSEITMADACLIPQLYNAHRFEVPLDNYPRLLEIEKECLKVEAFQSAQPENQPDTVKSSS